jgi:low affinity Fe/Cu permease
VAQVLHELFRRFARSMAILAGSTSAFVIAAALLLALLAAGSVMGYTDHWLALFSAVLSAVTFLMVFLLEYQESRDTAAIQLKLNELLRAVEGARPDRFLDLEHRAEDEQEDVSRKLREEVLRGEGPTDGAPRSATRVR